MKNNRKLAQYDGQMNLVWKEINKEEYMEVVREKGADVSYYSKFFNTDEEHDLVFFNIKDNIFLLSDKTTGEIATVVKDGSKKVNLADYLTEYEELELMNMVTTGFSKNTDFEDTVLFEENLKLPAYDLSVANIEEKIRSENFLNFKIKLVIFTVFVIVTISFIGLMSYIIKFVYG